ncbi:MAG: response regulator [Candidatus Sulfotelmatobacter sp.]
MHRLLLADDSEAVRLSIKSLLQRLAPDWEVCGETSEAEEAVRMAEQLKPDIILIDLSISGSNGLWVAKTLKDRAPFCKAILISEQSPGVLARLEAESGFVCLAKTQLASRLVPSLRGETNTE